MSMGNIRESLLSGYEEEQLRRQQQREDFERQNRGLLADFAALGDLAKPTPTQIRRKYQDELSPFPSLLSPTRVANQEQMLDEALMAQGMPTISGYPSPYITPTMETESSVEEPTASEAIGVTDTGVVSPEQFVQDATQYGEPATAFPIAERAKEEKEATKSRFAGLSDIFDNKEALGKIALGISLLEGTPMTEAFELYENFAGAGSSLDIEVYDKQLGKLVAWGDENDMSIRDLAKSDPNRFVLQAFGTQSSLDQDSREARLARFSESNNMILKEVHIPAINEAQTKIANGQKLLAVVNDPDFKSGVTESATLGMRQVLDQLGIKTDPSVSPQILFQTIISELIPNVRPAGAGATSDFEIKLYEKALPSLKNTPEQNRVIIEDFIKGAKINQARSNYVIEMSADTPDVSSVEHARTFSTLVNRAEEAIKNNQVSDLSSEERGLLGDIYSFVTEEELLNYDDEKQIPSNTIIIRG